MIAGAGREPTPAGVSLPGARRGGQGATPPSPVPWCSHDTNLLSGRNPIGMQSSTHNAGLPSPKKAGASSDVLEFAT